MKRTRIGWILAVGVCAAGVLESPGVAGAESDRRREAGERKVWELTLGSYLQAVLEDNETLQARWLESVAAWRRARAERGTFEPELFASIQRQINERLNTVEQQRSTLTSVFSERNNIYEGGLEGLLPSGARIRLGYTLRDLKNNLQSQPLFVSRGLTNGEFVTFVGVSVTQPLLKNAGPAATLAALRIAALDSDIAFQEYRRQLMLTLAQAEDAYWNLYMAQEQVRFFEESLATAEKLLEDNRKRLEAGRGSELEVLEAEAGVALRRARLEEARQKHEEAVARVLAFCSETTAGLRTPVRAVEAPPAEVNEPDLLSLWQATWQMNPDYQIQRLRLMQEANRVGYQRNQRLPELNLVGSYGWNGLGETPGDSWAVVEDGGYPSWSLGLELRFPVGGGVKARNQLRAARLQYEAAELSLRELERQIANALEVARQKLRASRAAVAGYDTLVRFNRTLLDSALARLEVGKLDSRKVLEIEEDLFESRNQLLDMLVQRQRALLELEVVSGRLLETRGCEPDRALLAAGVRRWTMQGAELAAAPASTGDEAREATAPAGRESPAQRRALEVLRRSSERQP